MSWMRAGGHGGRGEGGQGRGDGAYGGWRGGRGDRGGRGGRGRGDREDLNVGKLPDHHAKHLDLSGQDAQGFGQGRPDAGSGAAPKSNADFRSMFLKKQ